MDPRLAESLVAFEAELRRREADRQRLLQDIEATRRRRSSVRRWIGARLVDLGTRLEAASGPAPAAGWPPPPATRLSSSR